MSSADTRTPETPAINHQRLSDSDTSGGFFNFVLVEVFLREVTGLDTDTAQLMRHVNFSWPNQIDHTSWHPICARLIYKMAPMVLVARKNGYEVLGSGRSWNLATRLYHPNDKVPALVVSDKKRIPVADKLQVLAAEMLGLCAEYRTRPNLPNNLKRIWDRLNESGVRTTNGTDTKAFSRATGFSLASVQNNQSARAAPRRALIRGTVTSGDKP